jgi:predicted phage terminase large subunit-like protein
LKKKWPQIRRILIEESASGPAIIQMLEREISGILPIRAKGSKVVRLHWGVNSVAGFIEAGNFYLPRGHNAAEELVNEGASFPHGAHDDCVDAVVQGTQFLMPKSWSSLSRWGREIEEEKETGRGFVEQHRKAFHKAVDKKIALNLKNKEMGQDMPGWN